MSKDCRMKVQLPHISGLHRKFTHVSILLCTGLISVPPIHVHLEPQNMSLLGNTVDSVNRQLALSSRWPKKSKK